MALTREEQLDLPHEPGSWIRVRYPGHVLLDEVRRQRILEQVALWRAAGDVLKSIEAERVAEPDALNEYHVATLLNGCIVAWSYDEPVDAEHIAQLDEVTSRYVAERLVGVPAAPAATKAKAK